MADYTNNFIASFRQGSYHYNDLLTEFGPGAVEVYHDNRRYIYSMPDSKRNFRWWVERTFDGGDGVKVVGSYPSYRVKSK